MNAGLTEGQYLHHLRLIFHQKLERIIHEAVNFQLHIEFCSVSA